VKLSGMRRRLVAAGEIFSSPSAKLLVGPAAYTMER
jgi:hypothetical protein